jgi:hypothetical protein
MESVMEVLEKIEKEAVESSQEIRVLKKVKIGQAVRQGDIYLMRVSDDLKTGVQVKSTQLAPGTNQGSRHIVTGKVECFASCGERPKGCSDRVLLGPVVKSKESFEVQHPEHAWIQLPSGTYQTIYQLDPKKMQRVQD